MRIDKETIWHFVCKYCSGWWSIASQDAWQPKRLYCPHCGKINEKETKNSEKSDSILEKSILKKIKKQ